MGKRITLAQWKGEQAYAGSLNLGHRYCEARDIQGYVEEGMSFRSACLRVMREWYEREDAEFSLEFEQFAYSLWDSELSDAVSSLWKQVWARLGSAPAIAQ